MLGEEFLLVEEDLEGSRFARRDGDAREVRVVVVEQVLRQTGGSREIASGGAVFDPDRRLRPCAHARRHIVTAHRCSPFHHPTPYIKHSVQTGACQRSFAWKSPAHWEGRDRECGGGKLAPHAVRASFQETVSWPIDAPPTAENWPRVALGQIAANSFLERAARCCWRRRPW